jgi:WD40 repeat protein
MLRALVRTPRRRLIWLVLLVGLTWTTWALWPPAPQARWSLPPGEGNPAEFAPDGRTVITGRAPEGAAMLKGESVVGMAGPLVGRDADTGRERYRLFEAVARMVWLQMTPDGRRLTLAADAGDQAAQESDRLTHLFVLDPTDGRQLATLAGVTFQIEDLKSVSWLGSLEQICPVSPGGRWVAYRRRGDADLRLYDLVERRDGPVLPGARPPAAFSPDGRTLAARTADGNLGFWDVATGTARPTVGDRGPPVLAYGLRFSPDGRTLAAIILAAVPAANAPPPPAGGQPQPERVALWDATTGARRPDPPAPADPNQSILDMSFSPDGRFLAVQAAWPGWLWDLAADPPALVQFTPAESAQKWPFLPLLTPDGLALVATGPQELALFDPVTRERRQASRLRGEFVPSNGRVRFDPAGRTLLVEYLTETWLNRLPLSNRVRHWLRETGYASDHKWVVAAYDVATGRSRRAVESPEGRSGTFMAWPHPFGADGSSFWTVTIPRVDLPDRVVFERWPLDPPALPWWLIGLTAGAVGLAAADRARSRRKGA